MVHISILLKEIVNETIDDRLEEKSLQEKQELEDYIEKEMAKYENIDDFFGYQEVSKKEPQKYIVHRKKKGVETKKGTKTTKKKTK